MIIFILLLAVYLWSAPATVVFEDDGLFILAAWFNGIAHPPGYPLYTLFGHLFSWLPLGSVAYRLHAMSAVFGALCGACVYRLVQEWAGGGRVYAGLGAMAFGLSRIFWSQAIIAEVYTLNVLIILVLCIIAVHLGKNTAGKTADGRYLALMAFVYGLGLSNHWPLLVLSTPLLIAILWRRLPELMSMIPGALPFLFLGLLPYAWMVYRSLQDPVISFYGPITSWHDLWFYLSRRGYAAVDSNPSAGFIDKGRFALFFIKQFFLQYSLAGSPLIILGCLYQGRLLPRRVQAGLFLLLICNSFGLILLLDFNFDEFHRAVFRVYPLLSYFAACFYLVCGMRIINGWLKRMSLGAPATARITNLACFALVVAVFTANAPFNFRRDSEFARDFAAMILNNLSYNSRLFLNGDLYTGPVGYMNLVRGYRSDVGLNHVRGRFFATRLLDPNNNNYVEAKEIYDTYISESSSDIYYTYGLPHAFGVRDYGIFKQVLKHRSHEYHEYAIPAGLRHLIVSLMKTGSEHDPWERMALKNITKGYCSEVFIGAMASGDLSAWLSKPEHDVNSLCNTFHARLVLIELLLKQADPDLGLIQALAEQCVVEAGQAIFKGETAMPYYYLGEVEHLLGNTAKARMYYEKSAAIWHDGNNPALQELAVISNNRP